MKQKSFSLLKKEQHSKISFNILIIDVIKSITFYEDYSFVKDSKKSSNNFTYSSIIYSNNNFL